MTLEAAGRDPALERGDAEPALADLVRDGDHRLTERVVTRAEHVERAARERRCAPWNQIGQHAKRFGDARGELGERLRLREQPGQRVGKPSAITAGNRSFEAIASRVEIAGTQRDAALHPGVREQRLADRVVRLGERSAHGGAGHDHAHRALHRVGAPAIAGHEPDSSARRHRPR